MAVDQEVSAAPALEIHGLEKSFGAVPVLRNVSLAMQDGDFLVMVGPSGCGKSTLLNCIAGLETVTGGEIFIAGANVTEVPPRDRDIAMVFQSYALYPTMTVAENIAFGMKVRRIDKAEQERRTREVATLLQIDHLLDRRPAQLSGGQRQRVAMGRALVRQPKLFLFDEPLSNLDAKLRVEMRIEIKKLHERLGTSIVYVTHDQIEAMTLGTRIVVLKDGLIQQVGTPHDIYQRPANLFVADFMGSPPMNLLRGTCRRTDTALVVDIPAENGKACVTDADATAGLAAYVGREVIVGVRPEDFDTADAANADFDLVAQLVEHTGSDNFASFTTGGGAAIARLPARVKVEAGDRLFLKADRASLNYFDPETGLRIG